MTRVDRSRRLREFLAHPQPRALEDALARAGLLRDDPRLAGAIEVFDRVPDGTTGEEGLRAVLEPSLPLIERALEGELIIPDFATFATDLRDIFDQTRPLEPGI